MVIAFIGAGLLVFGGAAMIFQIAGDRGRDGSIWALAAIGLSIAAAWGAWVAAVTFEDPGLWAGFMPVIAAAAGHVAVAIVVLKTAPVGLDPRGSRWAMERLGSGRESEVVGLELGRGQLVIAGESGQATAIEYAEIREVRGDGETLVIETKDAARVRLCPHAEPPAREVAVRFCEALAERIRGELRSGSRR